MIPLILLTTFASLLIMGIAMSVLYTELQAEIRLQDAFIAALNQRVRELEDRPARYAYPTHDKVRLN